MAGDNHDAHTVIERFERIWIGFSLVLLVLFVTLVFVAVGMHGAHIGHAEPRQKPADILAMPEFADPGVRETGPGRYTVHMVAQAFSFVPGEMEFPVGSTVTFRMTSRDVIHGLQVIGTAINMELIPGDISSLTHTFERPGDYRIICNQYCGIAHHNMQGMIRVFDPEARVAAVDAPDEDADPDEVAAAWREPGRNIYNMQCAACHQHEGGGLPGVFPPLKGHAPELVAVSGGRDYMIDVILYGLGGAIEVTGVTYRGVMPGMPHLSDADVAAVVNHVLHAWGNVQALPDGFVPLEAEEVAGQRGLGLGPDDMLARRGALGLD